MGGYAASRKLSLRVEFYEKYIKFLSFLSTEIRYAAVPLPEIFEKYKDRLLVSDILEFCICEIHKGNTMDISWGNAVENIRGRYGLKPEDIDVIKGLGENLGVSDIEGQLSNCKLNIDMANTYLESAREEKKRKSKLYLMLGLFIGIAIALLIS